MKDENKKYFLLRKNTENYEHPDDFVEKFKEKKIDSWDLPKEASKDDIVYIYLTGKVKSIRIKTKIIEDDEELKLKLIRVLDTEKLNYKNLEKHGLNSVRNYQKIEGELLEYILKVEEGTLNQILYGPPGTGKTYNTIKKAIEIIDGKTGGSEDRDELKKKFDNYMENGQIKFITFHQSYSYEEFVEGLKAESDENNNIKYEIKDGVFKDICEKAKNIKI